MAIFSNKDKHPSKPTTYNIEVTNASEQEASIPVHVAKGMGESGVALTQIVETIHSEDVLPPVDLTLQKRSIEQSLGHIESGTIDPASMSYDIRDAVAEIRQLGVSGSVDAILGAIITECGAIESKAFRGQSVYDNVAAIRNLVSSL